MTTEFLISLGFSEKAAEAVSDFMGERVIKDIDPTTMKQSKKETPAITTNGAA
jgi:hypothetical protein